MSKMTKRFLSCVTLFLVFSIMSVPQARADFLIPLVISGGLPQFVPHPSGEQTMFGQQQPVFLVADNAVLPGQIGTAIVRVWHFPPAPNSAGPLFGPLAGVIVFRFTIPPVNDLIVFATAFQTGTGQLLTTVASALPNDQVGPLSRFHGTWSFAPASALGVVGAGPNDIVVALVLREGWNINNIDPGGSLTNFGLTPLFGPGNVISNDYGSGRNAEHRYFQLATVVNKTVDGYANADMLWHRSSAQTLGRDPITTTVDLGLVYFKLLNLYVATPCFDNSAGIRMCMLSASLPGLSFLGPVAIRDDGPNEDVTFGLGPDDWVMSGFFNIATPP